MIKKQNKSDLFTAFILCILLVINSCQSGSNDTNGNPVIIDSIKNDIEKITEQETEYFEVDTLTVQDRFLEGNSFNSHINLDFVRTTKNINDSSIILFIDKICAVMKPL